MTPARVFNPESRYDDRERLLHIVASCLASQPFTRSDGRTVTNYVQGHLVLGDPEGLRLASSLILDAIRDTDATVVAGEVSAACALVSGIVTLSAGTDSPLAGRYVRKETRGYGVPGPLNAPLPSDSHVFLVDDVAATGASGVRCVETLRSLGHNVVAMMVVVDRGQGAAECLARLVSTSGRCSPWTKSETQELTHGRRLAPERKRPRAAEVEPLSGPRHHPWPRRHGPLRLADLLDHGP